MHNLSASQTLRHGETVEIERGDWRSVVRVVLVAIVGLSHQYKPRCDYGMKESDT